MASRNTRSRYKAEPGGFSRVTTDMQSSEAFQSLSAKALRVLLHALFLNYNSASKTTGQPVFKFTNAMAKAVLGMHPATFTRAKVELADRGFIRWEKRGGLKGSNGVPSEFSLSGDWKKWTKNRGQVARVILVPVARVILVKPFSMPKITKAVTPLRLVLTQKQSHRCDTLKTLPHLLLERTE